MAQSLSSDKGSIPPPEAPVQPAAASAAQRRMRRLMRNFIRGVLTPIAAILAALAVSAIILLAAGYNPVTSFAAMWHGAFGDLRTFTEVLIYATPLILIGSGLAVAFRCSIWNIGAEGQFYAGAVSSTIIGIYVHGLSPFVEVPLILIAAALGGALWGMLAAWLKVRFNSSEIVTTIMLNYIAIVGTSYLVTGPMIEAGGHYPQTDLIDPAAMLPRFLPPTRLHIGFLVALLVAVTLYVLLFKTSTGYAIRAVGINAETARYAGMNIPRNIMLAMAISGGAAGLAGGIELAGIAFRLYQDISPGFGYDGIAVALLANNNPLGIILSGILFGALRSGSEMMQITAHIPSVLVFAIQGLIILSVVAFGVYRARSARAE
ncbi:MAG: ABC transporter permease [Anaerolineaceae bacterium]|nr:ABC transporter permease [Anaerolineaceae bacterium]